MDKLAPYYKRILDTIHESSVSYAKASASLVDKYEPHLPISVQINLLNKCYQRCIGCRKYEWPDIELPTSTVIDVMMDISKVASVRSLVFSGGEPTMYDNFVSILACAKVLNFDVGVLTSAVFPKTLPIDFLVNSSNWISISIDGATREMYKKTRGLDSLELAKENVLKMKHIIESSNKIECTLRCNSTISNVNISEMPDILALCNTLDIDCNFFPIHTWNNLKVNHEASIEHIIKAQVMDVNVNSNIDSFIPMLKRKKPKFCIVPYVHCFIDANGDVLPCCRVANDNGDFTRNEELVMGNVLKTPFKEIWDSSLAEKIRNRIFSANEPVCLECDRYNLLNYNFTEWYTSRNTKKRVFI